VEDSSKLMANKGKAPGLGRSRAHAQNNNHKTTSGRSERRTLQVKRRPERRKISEKSESTKKTVAHNGKV